MKLFLLDCRGGTGGRFGTSPSGLGRPTFEVEPLGFKEEGGVTPPGDELRVEEDLV
jgi:hypothetical protein